MNTITEKFNEVQHMVDQDDLQYFNDIGIEYNLDNLRNLLSKGKTVHVLNGYGITLNNGDERYVVVLLLKGKTLGQCWGNKKLKSIANKVDVMESPFEIEEIVDSGKKFKEYVIWNIKGQYL